VHLGAPGKPGTNLGDHYMIDHDARPVSIDRMTSAHDQYNHVKSLVWYLHIFICLFHPRSNECLQIYCCPELLVTLFLF